MNASIYQGLGLYELKELRLLLQERLKDYAAGRALSAVGISGNNTQKNLLTIKEIRAELAEVQNAIRTHPDALASDRPAGSPVRRFRADFSRSVIC